MKKLSIPAATLGVGLALAATAYAAVGEEGLAQARPGGELTELRVIERGSERFDRAVTEHRTDKLSGRYRDLYDRADELGAAPSRSVVAGSTEPSVAQLERGLGDLRDRIADARKAAAAAPAESGEYGLAGGVSQATLDAIAACESGGDPTAVNGAGYYGKYQFDMGTWQSVGGTGNPAEASEEEQDMRASMLYAQAGSSPWPVCGQ